MKDKKLYQRLLSLTLSLVMLLSFTSGVGATAENETIKNITSMTFEELRNHYGKMETPFESVEDAGYYREAYVDHLYPSASDNGMYFNRESLLLRNTAYYGSGLEVTKAGHENKQDSKGEFLYLGFSKDDKLVTNVNVNETNTVGMKQITNIDANQHRGGNVKMELTDYNKADKVGQMYLQNGSYSERIQLGNQIQDKWIDRMTNRLQEFYRAEPYFKDFLSRDTILNNIAILAPPTARSNGQILTWFESGTSRQTHRTMFIEQTEPINFVNHEMTTKLNEGVVEILYGIEGDDLIEGKIQHSLYLAPYQYGLDQALEGFVVSEEKYNDRGIDVTKTTFGTDEGYAYLYTTVETTRNHEILASGGELGWKTYVPLDLPQEEIVRMTKDGYTATSIVNSGVALAGTYSEATFKNIVDGYTHGFIEYPSSTPGSEQYTYLDNFNHDYLEVSPDILIENNIGDKTGHGTPEGANTSREVTEEEIDNDTLELEFMVDTRDFLIDLVEASTLPQDMPVTLYKNEKPYTTQDVTIGFKEFPEGLDYNSEEYQALLKEIPYNPIDVTFSIPLDELDKGETEFSAVINADYDLTEFTHREEMNLENNKATIKIDYDNEPDIAIKSKQPTLKVTSKDDFAELDFTVTSEKMPKSGETKVDLYKDGQVVDTRPINIEKSTEKKTQNVTFIVSTDDLEEGDHKYEVVVNSNYDLSRSTPIDGEENLANNKDSITLTYELVEEEEKEVECGFNEVERANSYSVRRSSGDESWCEGRTYETKRTSSIAYTDYDMRSDSYGTFRDVQDYGAKHNVPKGFNKEGNPATDTLMSSIGYNPLHQSLRAGRGMQVRGKISIGGYSENVGSYDPSSVVTYIEDILENGIEVDGTEGFEGTKDSRNNTGTTTQKLILDEQEGSYLDGVPSGLVPAGLGDLEDLGEIVMLNVNGSYGYYSTPQGSGKSATDMIDKDKFYLSLTANGTRTYGSSSCTQIEVYTVGYDSNIPTIISKPTGKIDVIGGEKVDLDGTNEWYTYLNDLDGVYGLGLVTTAQPSKIGIVSGDTSPRRCVVSPNEFVFSIRGTIFEDVNTETPDGSDWDN